MIKYINVKKMLFEIKENCYIEQKKNKKTKNIIKIFAYFMFFHYNCKYGRYFSLKLVNEFIYRILIHVFKMRSNKGSGNHAEAISNSAQEQYFTTFLIASCKVENAQICIRTSSSCLFTLFN